MENRCSEMWTTKCGQRNEQLRGHVHDTRRSLERVNNDTRLKYAQRFRPYLREILLSTEKQRYIAFWKGCFLYNEELFTEISSTYKVYSLFFFIEIGSTKRNAVKHTKVTKKCERKLPGNQQRRVLIALF